MPTVIDKSGTTMGGEAALPTNPEKGRASKRKEKNADSLNDESTGALKMSEVYGPG